MDISDIMNERNGTEDSDSVKSFREFCDYIERDEDENEDEE